MSRPPPSRPPTGLDVAEKAGVSQSTVSLVMSGKAQGRVSPEKQALVLKAARELEYYPNAAARSLRLGRTSSVALVVTNVVNPFFSPVFRGAEEAARKLNYAVLLLDAMSDPNWMRWMPELLSAQSLDGCIVYSGYPLDPADVSRLSPHVVLIESAAPNASSVQLDIGGAAKQAVEHLVRLGHTRIGYVAADYPMETFRQRFAAYREVLDAHGIPFVPAYVIRTNFEIDGAVTAARRLLRPASRPTAIFCEDDLLAAAVYKAARIAGLHVPADLSVVGFGDLELSKMLEPALTTVSIPAERVGREAMALMKRLVDDGTPRTRLMRLKLVVRASTAPPQAQNRERSRTTAHRRKVQS